ncbi:MAG: zinc-dependent alcohol dehydrogenase [Blautia sp.]|jgi:L-iditol 2-dehydrogenase
MKAIVKYEMAPYRTRLMEVPMPQCQEDQVLLKVMAAGVCGSDIDMWKHTAGFSISTPVIHGHEFCGVIVKTGDRVKHFHVHDRVVCETASYICGECRYCRTGQYNQCPSRLGYGALVDGAMAEYVAVPERILHRLPDGLSFETAALTEPCCVAYNAMMVKTRIQPGRPVAIIGPGTIGLLCVAMAKLAGAYPVILIGRKSSENRMKLAECLGADAVLYSDLENVKQRVGELTGEEVVPIVCDCAGNEETFALSMDLVAGNGQITKVGWGPRPIQMSLDPIVQKAACIQGAFSHTWDTWETVIRLLAHNRLPIEPFLTHVYSIDRWEDGFRAMADREAVKSIILPGQ